MRNSNKLMVACAIVSSVILAMPAAAQPIFTDDFHNNTSSLLWGNERGFWTVINDQYAATQPSNNPCTYSSLPFDLADMEIECDVLATNDGGIWVHTNAAGTTGILFVLAHNQAYWHTVTNNSFTGPHNAVNAFSSGQNLHLRIAVVGSTYSAYIDGSATPITTFTTAGFPSGRTGLYDFTAGGHRYDNIVLSGDCITDTCCPYISRNPEHITICATGIANLHAEGAGSSLTYSWQYEIIGGEWVTIEEGENSNGGFLFNATGSETGDLSLDRGSEKWESSYNVRCVVTNECGEAISEFASITVCPADFDCTGFVDLDDYVAFVHAFEEGGDNADFDGSGFVDLDDFIAFVHAFEGGC
ncbi:MAG: EF-hand domain-containing protein [Phycisphaerales bacterium]|nr:EF-hand domain-containing protein [Phycisphaerales bacterium]